MSYTQEDLDKAVKNAVREERTRCLSKVDSEKGLWVFNSQSKAVRLALEHVKALIRGEK